LAGSAINDTFLTDAVGRTLYVCLDDEPSTDTGEAVSSCVADCTLSRPIVTSEISGADAVLPSVLDSSAFSMWLRPDGLRQLTYRGWPLYYFSGDLTAGATEGHNENAWRAIEPVSFGIASEPISLD
jgi:predicted lipoprotein with Yx(FWY)xxD motif